MVYTLTQSIHNRYYKSQLPDTDPRHPLRQPHSVVHTKVDAQCDKLTTDDRRQFITLSVHLS